MPVIAIAVFFYITLKEISKMQAINLRHNDFLLLFTFLLKILDINSPLSNQFL